VLEKTHLCMDTDEGLYGDEQVYVTINDEEIGQTCVSPNHVDQDMVTDMGNEYDVCVHFKQYHPTQSNIYTQFSHHM